MKMKKVIGEVTLKLPAPSPLPSHGKFLTTKIRHAAEDFVFAIRSQRNIFVVNELIIPHPTTKVKWFSKIFCKIFCSVNVHRLDATIS